MAVGGLSFGDRNDGVTLPTKTALWQHNELQVEQNREAAAEAAAVLAQLPVRARLPAARHALHKSSRAKSAVASPHTSETARHASAAGLRRGTPIRQPASIS